MFEELALWVHNKSLVELLVFSWTERIGINHLILAFPTLGAVVINLS
jgi:hypothetical protein